MRKIFLCKILKFIASFVLCPLFCIILYHSLSFQVFYLPNIIFLNISNLTVMMHFFIKFLIHQLFGVYLKIQLSILLFHVYFFQETVIPEPSSDNAENEACFHSFHALHCPAKKFWIIMLSLLAKAGTFLPICIVLFYISLIL